MNAVIASEIGKIRSTRSLRNTLAASGVVTIALGVFVGLTGSLQPDDTELGGALTGVVIGQILAGVLGTLVMTSETTTGTIACTFAAVPRRRVVLVGKAIVVFVGSFVVGLAASAAALLVGRALIDGDHAAGEPFPALLGVAFTLGVAAVLGLAVGTLVRHPGGAVASVLGVVLVPQLLGPLFGDLQPWVMGLSPATALQKMTQTSDASTDVAGSLGPWPSLGIVAAVSLALLLIAARRLDRRDV